MPTTRVAHPAPQEVKAPPIKYDGHISLAPETKKERFERIGQLRMTNALHAVRLLGNLSAAAIYEYSETEVEQMKLTLLEALETSFATFTKRTKTKDAFSFSR